MTRKLLSALIASLFAVAPALAQDTQDPLRIEGGGSIGGIYNRQNADDKAKLQEYQDVGNGALSNVWARGRNSTTWFEGYGENFGRDDQYMFIRGGVYGVFKAGAYLNDMPHDFSTNAITPFAGVGSEQLVATFPRPVQGDGGSRGDQSGGEHHEHDLPAWRAADDDRAGQWRQTRVRGDVMGTGDRVGRQ